MNSTEDDILSTPGITHESYGILEMYSYSNYIRPQCATPVKTACKMPLKTAISKWCTK